VTRKDEAEVTGTKDLEEFVLALLTSRQNMTARGVTHCSAVCLTQSHNPRQASRSLTQLLANLETAFKVIAERKGVKGHLRAGRGGSRSGEWTNGRTGNSRAEIDHGERGRG